MHSFEFSMETLGILDFEDRLINSFVYIYDRSSLGLTIEFLAFRLVSNNRSSFILGQRDEQRNSAAAGDGNFKGLFSFVFRF